MQLLAKKYLKVDEVKIHPNNPRIIKDASYKRLLKSIQDFPEMAEARPLVINDQFVILGGNMRFRAMVECGWTEVPVIQVDWSEDQQDEFMLKDNVSFGDWDWDILANSWEAENLKTWGVIHADYKIADTDFTPNVNPSTDVSDITKDQIIAAAKKLADQMVTERQTVECICPKCGHEFKTH